MNVVSLLRLPNTLAPSTSIHTHTSAHPFTYPHSTMISCSNKGKNKITCVDVNARAWRVCRTRVVHNFPCLGNGVVRNFIPRTFLFLSISNLFCHFDAFHFFFILPPFISRFFFIFFWSLQPLFHHILCIRLPVFSRSPLSMESLYFKTIPLPLPYSPALLLWTLCLLSLLG